MVLTSTSVLVVEKPPKCLPPVSMSPEWVPVASYLSGRLSKISKWSFSETSQITRSALGLGLCEIFAHLLRVKSFSPTVLWLSHTQTPLAFKVRYSGDSCRTSGLGSTMWVSDSWLLGGIFTIVIILSLVDYLPRGVGLDYTMSLLFLSSCCASLFIYLVLENLFM